VKKTLISFLIFAPAVMNICGQEKRSSVSGHVFDADTKTPVEGVKVGSHETGYAMTDAEGAYIIKDIKPGPAKIGVQERNGGYLAMSLTVPQSVTIDESRDRSGVDFHVRLDASISGRVVDENSEPLTGMRVVAINRKYSTPEVLASNEYSNGELWGAVQGGAAKTDDRGSYTINGVFAGRSYLILAFDPAELAGPVSDASADPLSRKRTLVATYYPNSSVADNAAPVVVHSLEDRQNVDIHMARSASYCLEATLKSGESPVGTNFAVVEDEIFQALSSSPRLLPRTGMSGSGGEIRVCGLHPASYRVVTFSSYSSTPSGIVVTIGDHDLSGPILPVLPPLKVSGEVVWDQAPVTPLAAPRLGIRTLFSNTIFPRNQVFSEIPGEFALEVMPSNHYSLSVSALAPQFYIKDIAYDGSSILHSSFVPIPGSGKLRITLGRDGGSITARVLGRDGQAMAGSLVLIFPADAQSEAALATSLVTGLTASDGMYTSEALSPGRYTVLATNDLPPGIMKLPIGTFAFEKTPESLKLLLQASGPGEKAEISAGGHTQITLLPKNIQ